MLKRVVLAALLFALTACGGGGGGTAAPAPAPGPLPTGSLSGRVDFSTGLPGVVVEEEPNDTLGEARPLAALPLGGRLTVLGRLEPDGDPADVRDAFQLRLPQRARVQATLLVHDSAAYDVDLALYDAIGLQYVASFEADTSPQTAVFYAKGVVDLVLHAVRGGGAYELQLQADLPSAALSEIEPNDAADAALYSGEVIPSDTVAWKGDADPLTDPIDAVLVVCSEAVHLDLRLALPAFATFRLRVLDGTLDLGAPDVLLESSPSTSDEIVEGLDVPAGRLIAIEVEATDIGGAWTLQVEGSAPSGSAKALRLPVDRLASTRLEGRRIRASRATTPYGQVVHPLVPGEAVVRFRRGDGTPALSKRGAQATGAMVGGTSRVRFAVSEALSEEDGARYTMSRVRALAGAEDVVYAEPNFLWHACAEPDDPYYPLQWHYDQIHLAQAWEVTTGDPDVIVAVLDTGRTAHPDLAGRQSGGYDLISSASMAGDGNGIDADPTDVGDLSSGSRSSWHGTHVAGTIGAATDNGTGVAGVTWSGQIMHVRVLGIGGGTSYDVTNGILYAAALANSSGTVPPVRADVINMSLGGGGYSQSAADACQAAWQAGVVVCASAGNENTSSPSYPAAYADVISVMAVDAGGNRAPYSNYGTTVDLAAPGGNTYADLNADGYADGVWSTLWNDSVSPKTPNYRLYQGTSMACPHVAGLAALLRAVDPSISPDDVFQVLAESATDLGTTGRDDVFGYGLIDAARAVGSASPEPPPVEPPPLLGLLSDALGLGSTANQRSVPIVNLGGGLLEVSAPEVHTESGGAWLSAELVLPGDATRSARALRVEVDRTGMTQGTYLGSVTLSSNGGTAVLDVSMGVGLDAPPPPDLDIRVQAVRVDSGEVVAETTVNPAGSLTFSFPTLPTGDYYVIAGTDLDADGTICGDGDYCGAYPLHGAPQRIVVIRDTESDRVDFPVTQPTSLGD